MKTSRSSLLLLVWLTLPAGVRAQEDLGIAEEEGRYEIVQERAFPLRHELSVAGGFLPLDAFYKGVSASVGYTHHFNEQLAWQVARGTYSFNFDTGLRSQLLREFGVLPTAFREVQWMVGSDALYSPFYGKTALLNRWLFHFQLYVLGGATLIRTQDAFSPALNLGAGMRWFSNSRLSVRFEVTHHIAPGRDTFTVPVMQLAASFNLGTR